MNIHSTNIPSNSIDPEAISNAYQQAYASALSAVDEPLDRLLIKGSDRIDLLERLSTNTFKQRRDGHHLHTMLLEPNGRLIDLLDVFIFSDHFDIALTSTSSERVVGWLKRHRFFQDDVTVERSEPSSAVMMVLGPHSDQYLEVLFGGIPDLSPGDFYSTEDNIITPVQWQRLSGYRVLAQSEAAATRISNLVDSTTPTASRLAVEALRIEAGVPRRGREIQAGVIPLEVRLQEAISFSKGCYIGQEVIARLDSRGGLAAQLMGVKLSAPAAAGVALEQAGKEIGSLTACSFSPRNGWIGLGLIKTHRWDPSAGQLSIEGMPIRVQELPFT